MKNKISIHRRVQDQRTHTNKNESQTHIHKKMQIFEMQRLSRLFISYPGHRYVNESPTNFFQSPSNLNITNSNIFYKWYTLQYKTNDIEREKKNHK